ncbi:MULTISPECIES: hypothetical protein [unclassified Agromyces]|uniref:hypothetical protein n=1 Tax=unclassified Agromyces TaxID=2639701 RepID=UPI0030143E54
MTMIEKRRRRRRLRATAYAGVTLAWALTVWLSTMLAAPEWARMPVLFVHLASLVVGLGAVLMIEWHGLLWATGWSTAREVRQADRTLILPVWVGLGGLLASGALLQPDLAQPLTVVKLVAVLVLSLNGVALTKWTSDLARMPAKAHFRALPRAARIGYLASGAVSQLAWWTAVVIGMFNSTA